MRRVVGLNDVQLVGDFYPGCEWACPGIPQDYGCQGVVVRVTTEQNDRWAWGLVLMPGGFIYVSLGHFTSDEAQARTRAQKKAQQGARLPTFEAMMAFVSTEIRASLVPNQV